MASANKKIAEGLEYLAKGDKCMKTGFLKWKPDYEEAISMYTKAGVAFKNAKSWEQATASFLKSAEVQKEIKQNFHAAKSIESAAMIYKEMEKLDRAADLFEEACNLYLSHGVPDTALITLEKAGKMIEAKDPDRAIRMYLKGIDVAEAEDKVSQSAEMAGRAARLFIRKKDYDEAVKALRREMNIYASVDNHGLVNKLVMAMVLLQLHRQDYVAADKEFRAGFNYPGFGSSEEAGPIERLLDAYDQGDEETVRQITRDPLFRYMENDFTKLARDLVVPGAESYKPKKVANMGNGDGGGGGASTSAGQQEEEDDEEDEYAGGLL